MKDKKVILGLFIFVIVSLFFVIGYKKTNIVNLPNKPALVDGMIPVYYDNDNKVWRKASKKNNNNSWYDYKNGKWANVILVSDNKQNKKLSKSRKEYMDAKEGTVILYTDILAFYVWIPRYKYQLFNVEFDELEEKVINVSFERGTNSTGSVKCKIDDNGVEVCDNKKNGNWYTHPAFTFGDTELSGIWVGKFETTGTEDNPTILPNMVALTNQSVLEQYYTALKFSSYLNSDKIDSHMAKNIEWGAVAYLSQSKYGRCNGNCIEIYQNNSMGITGRSMGNVAIGQGEEENEYITTFGNYTYDDRTVNEDGVVLNYLDSNLGSGASTTGNITGVYDMSGGSNEYTMGTIKKLDSILSKYYDLYATSDASDSFNRSHLGDATGETRGWYGDKECLVDNSKAFSKRGCSSIGGTKSGLFYFCGIDGSAYLHISFRSVLVVSDE